MARQGSMFHGLGLGYAYAASAGSPV